MRLTSIRRRRRRRRRWRQRPEIFRRRWSVATPVGLHPSYVATDHRRFLTTNPGGTPLIIRGKLFRQPRPALKDVLRKSESWCSQHWRLYRDRYILQHALDWAGRTKHKLAGSYAIEQLLKIIADYKLTILGASARPPRKPSAPKPLASQAPPPDSIEKLLSLMSDAERELELVRLDD